MTKSQYSVAPESGGSTDMDYSILEKFADMHRLKISKDDCNEPIIRGRHGQVYEYDNSQLAVMFMPAEWKPRQWGTYRRSALALGMRVLQNGDAEGALAFDPENNEQAKLALKIARVKRRRNLSPERVVQLKSYLEKARNSRLQASVEGHSSG